MRLRTQLSVDYTKNGANIKPVKWDDFGKDFLKQGKEKEDMDMAHTGEEKAIQYLYSLVPNMKKPAAWSSVRSMIGPKAEALLVTEPLRLPTRYPSAAVSEQEHNPKDISNWVVSLFDFKLADLMDGKLIKRIGKNEFWVATADGTYEKAGYKPYGNDICRLFCYINGDVVYKCQPFRRLNVPPVRIHSNKDLNQPCRCGYPIHVEGTAVVKFSLKPSPTYTGHKARIDLHAVLSDDQSVPGIQWVDYVDYKDAFSRIPPGWSNGVSHT